MKTIFILSTFVFLLFTSTAALAEIRYVSKTGTATPPYTSWATASDSIQKCINICNYGDTVIVANGVYREYLLIETEIALLGTSMDSTIIDGTGLGYDYTIQSNADVVISGFTIIGKGFNDSPYYVGVVTISNNLNIYNCKISNCNYAFWVGQSSGVMEGLIITNVYTGITTACAFDTCKPIIKNSVILPRNDMSNRGITISYDGQPVILNNIIIGGYGMIGIYNVSAKRLVIKNNLIAGGYVNIRASNADSAFIINNIIREQSSDFYSHAAIQDPNIRAYIRNNAITDNYKGIHASNAHSNFNIFWNNEVHANNGSIFGDNDLFVDPMFVKDTTAKSFAYDYHLQKYSPAIDAGDTSVFDIDGTRSDIGLFGGPGGSLYTYLNLPPKPPVNFHAVYDSNKIIINWDKFSEADFSHYKIYRSLTNNFIPDSSSYYCKSDSSYFIDELPLIKDKIYYKITSVDSDGNESYPGEQIVITITSTNEPLIEIVGEYKLYQNFPNPFNPVTIIPYRIKERAYVKIMVYDIKGELIEVLVNSVKEAGYYETEFNGQNLASGIYLYRIEVVNNRSIPVYMNMKKMILVK